MLQFVCARINRKYISCYRVEREKSLLLDIKLLIRKEERLIMIIFLYDTSFFALTFFIVSLSLLFFFSFSLLFRILFSISSLVDDRNRCSGSYNLLYESRWYAPTVSFVPWNRRFSLQLPDP